MIHKNCLYLIVTDDKYELPLYVADYASQISRLLGVCEKTVCRSIKNGNALKKIYIKSKVKVVRVEV